MPTPDFSIINLVPFGVGFGIITLAAIYYLLHQEVTKRQRAEVVLRQQTERERLVNQIAQHIRESLDLDEVLTTTVAEVREFLQADRVLIYRLWEDGTGSAIDLFENSKARLFKALGQNFDIFVKTEP